MVQIRKDKARVGATGMERRGEERRGQRDSGAGHYLGTAQGWGREGEGSCVESGEQRVVPQFGLQKGEELLVNSWVLTSFLPFPLSCFLPSVACRASGPASFLL